MLLTSINCHCSQFGERNLDNLVNVSGHLAH
jgi:hypothetical protein